MKEVKIAMVGTGFAANLHAENYKRLMGVDAKIVAVASKELDQAQEFVQEFGIDPSMIFDDGEKMIDEIDADIVDLVVPTVLHVPFAIRAAKAGKNIICEKPLTGYFGDPSVPLEERENVGGTDKLTMFQECLKTCQEIDEVMKENDVVFCYAENWCYAPPITKAKGLLKAANSKILDMRCGESHSGSHSKFAAQWKYTGGGALIRMGSHPYGAVVHMKMWEGLLRDGTPILPKSIVASTARYRDFLDQLPREQDVVVSRPVDVEDWSTGILTFTDGTSATVIASDVCLGGIENWMNIYGSNTRIETRISNNNSVQAYAPSEKEFQNEYTIEKTETKAGWSSAQPDEDWMTGYPFELQDFIECSLTHHQPSSNLDLAIWTAKVMYAAYLSAETGRRIEIPQGYEYIQ